MLTLLSSLVECVLLEKVIIAKKGNVHVSVNYGEGFTNAQCIMVYLGHAVHRKYKVRLFYGATGLGVI